MIFLGLSNIQKCWKVLPNQADVTVNYTNHPNSIPICIQTARRYIWQRSTTDSISTSPTPIIHFGLSS